MTNNRKLSDLALDSGNANKGTERGRQAIEASIREFGFADAGTLDKHNTIIGGNKRTLAAGVIGMDEAIIIDVDGTQPVYIRRNDLDLSSTEDDRARRLAYALNRSQQLSLDWDADQVLADLNAGFDLSALFRQDELDEMLADLQPKGTEGDTEPQIDRAEELRQKWQVETGQMWQLGEHLLVCGDCTDAAVVARVMAGEKATLAPVDPPYNVGFDYDGETVDDSKIAEAYETFSREWFGVCQSVSERQIVTPGCYNLASWLRWFDAYHWGPWTKTNSMTNGRVSRFWCWEPVLFFGEHWGKKRHSDVFDYPIGQQKGVANHPCPKPLAMWEDLLTNYSEPGDVIYEAFLGSGTTLIACERLGRRCRAVEISPGYVAVALERFHQHSGKLPVLITGE